MKNLNELYWDSVAEEYQHVTRISCDDFHYGPLLPGDRSMKLLPDQLEGLRCLELGCGAGQNSIYMAKRGARCAAFDISVKQLEIGRKMADREGVSVDFFHADVDELSAWGHGHFDLIHSTYSLPFSRFPAGVVKQCSDMLNVNGMLLQTAGHPLYGGSWVELETGEEGVLVQDYYNIPPDERECEAGEGHIESQFFTVSEMFSWFRCAGLTVENFIEPRPLPVDDMSPDQISQLIPYYSDDWAALYQHLARIPLVMVFQGCKRSL